MNYQLSKLVTERGPIQFAVVTSHRPENAMGKRDGFEWWTWLSFWAQKTQDLIQHCKSANMLFQKYADLRRSYVLFKPSWPLVKWSRHQCKSSVCRVFCTTNWIKVLFPCMRLSAKMWLSMRKYWSSCCIIFSVVGTSLGEVPSFKYWIRCWGLSLIFLSFSEHYTIPLFLGAIEY